MKIELHEIPIRDIVNGYEDNAEEGIVGYGGLLNIRPKYQREFVYPEDKRKAVIETIFKGFPLNVMCWIKKNDGTFELLDGQQRTVSFCQYYDNQFSVDMKQFHNLPTDKANDFLNYKVMVYFCEGTESEQLEWFKTINIGCEELTPQELRNAVYTGEWLTAAKRYFSKTNCAGYNMGKDYLSGSPIRQEYLETVIGWKANQDTGKKVSDSLIREYMAEHQHDPNCNELWLYYTSVINWIQTIFPKTRKEMKGLPWGEFYNKYHNNPYDANTLESRIVELMIDDEVTSNKGIYEYLLSGEEKTLNLRSFSEQQKRAMYERQHGICPRCVALNKPTKNKVWQIEEMHGDHITPWCEGGKTSLENGQMLCANCNREKSST